VLVANRGEIACRVIATCRRLGIHSIALFSDADRHARHVRLADEAHYVGPAPASQSYLDVERVLRVARVSGAEAIHPGYGFLSENTEFAAACAAAGIGFIGPSPDAIRRMGLKHEAKSLAESAGVPVVPGYHGEDTRPATLAREAERIGYPLLVKAVAGGGGKGMRVVRDAGELADAVAAATSEAANSFRDGRILLERFIERPRHVEVQVFGDTRGALVHLFERECSIQRRYQKIVEESPSPFVTPAMREAMTAAAVRAAAAVGYVNAGTVEFVVGADRSFYFLEMNTRLQVEHPVTESVTGLDLVEWQLRVAAGEPLPFTQDDVRIEGHAIECRINAEDPAGGAFLPSPGRITKMHAPSGFGTRWDGGYETGDEISQFYDNLTGKLCVWGRDRDVAIARMIRALEEMEIEGIATVIPADLAILRHPDFSANEHSTKWVENVLDLSGVKASLHASMPADDEAEPKVRRDVDVEVNGKRFEVSLFVPESQLAAPAGGGGKAAAARPKRSRGAGGGAGAAAGSGRIAAPMQGTIVKVTVEAGQTVAAGDTVVVLEAMKMENNVAADVDGTVAEVKVEAGQSVGAGEILVVIE
jgi:acetyl-CoA/propionyl-CoA carboxylase biotin carboxyl carrier protein